MGDKNNTAATNTAVTNTAVTNTAATNTAATNTAAADSPDKKRPAYSNIDEVGSRPSNVTSGVNRLPLVDTSLNVVKNGISYNFGDYFAIECRNKQDVPGTRIYNLVPTDKAKALGITGIGETNGYLGETAYNNDTIGNIAKQLSNYSSVTKQAKDLLTSKLPNDVPDTSTSAVGYVPENLTESKDPTEVQNTTLDTTAKAFQNRHLKNTADLHNEWTERTNDEAHLDAMDPHRKSTFMNEWRDDDGDGQPDNFNGMSFNATRNLARAADRLNNREWWNGGTVMQAGMGANGTATGGRDDYAYKKQPIQTWETRQMDKMNRVDERRINRDVDRAAKVLDWNVDSRMMADKQELDVIKNILGGDQDFANKIKSAIIEVQISNPDRTRQQELLHRFIQDVSINEKAYYQNQIMQIFENDGYMAAIMYASLCHGFTQLDPESYIMSKILPDYRKKHPNESPIEGMLKYYYTLYSYKGEIAAIQQQLTQGQITQEQYDTWWQKLGNKLANLGK